MSPAPPLCLVEVDLRWQGGGSARHPGTLLPLLGVQRSVESRCGRGEQADPVPGSVAGAECFPLALQGPRARPATAKFAEVLLSDQSGAENLSYAEDQTQETGPPPRPRSSAHLSTPHRGREVQHHVQDTASPEWFLFACPLFNDVHP